MQERNWIVLAAAAVFAASLTGCERSKQTSSTQSDNTSYTFERSFPSGEMAAKAYDDTDLNSAITAYKFFYPTVSKTYEGVSTLCRCASAGDCLHRRERHRFQLNHSVRRKEKDSNWIPTDPDRKFELMFRAYAPTEALFQKTWVLPDVEKVQ